MALPHIAIVPFMSKSHTLPLLHLTHLLHHHHLTSLLTIFTTPLNSPLVHHFLSKTSILATVVELPFPANFPDLPSSFESTDKLTYMSHFHSFVVATKLLQPSFEHAIQHSPSPIDLIISDGFLVWSNQSAKKFSIPRLLFYGMGGFAVTVTAVVSSYKLVTESDEPFEVPGFPSLKLTKDDLAMPFNEPNPTPGPHLDYVNETMMDAMASEGMIVNTFYEVESVYLDRWNDEFKPKAWPVGPFCLAQAVTGSVEPGWVQQWLDSRLAMNRPVLYVSFGSQADIEPGQMEEIAVGLDRSGFEFLWVVRAKESGLPVWFVDRVKGRTGLVVNEWVDQWAILNHEAIKGFVSHCGWSSVMESVSAGVPMLAWPMMAEQHLNAVFVVQVLRMGLRVRASDGTRDGIVKGEDLGSLVKELMEGEGGEKARERARELKGMACGAMREDVGSSWVSLRMMIETLCMKGK